MAGLRRRAGLPVGDTREWLQARLESRGGLFFANPYLMDWVLALALAGTPSASRLCDEILASAHSDGSFGTYDEPLSTALAILSLAALGETGRAVRRAQLRLVDWLESDGRLPAATPFYSALGGAVEVEVEVTLYRDDERLMTTAAAASALAVPSTREPSPPLSGGAHARYRCGDVGEYVRRFALPPYLDGGAHADAQM